MLGTERQKRSGQVVTEYVMILTFVVAALATTKMRITASGELDLAGTDPSAKTIMKTMSDSFTIWMQDILIIIALPS